MGGLIAPMPVIGKPAGRAVTDIGTLGLAELLPSNTRQTLNNGVGSLLFSPASLLAAGGAGFAGAGGIGGGGMGAAGPGTTSAGLGGSALPAGAGVTLDPRGLAAVPPVTPPVSPGLSGNNMLQNAFLATSVGSMLGNAIEGPPPPSMSVPNAPVGHGSGFTPVANSASQQWAQLMAQRRAQQTGKFTV